MAKVIVDTGVLSSVPTNLDSVVDSLLESARKQLEKAKEIFITNKKVKNNIQSLKKIDTLIVDATAASKSVQATSNYTSNMVSLIKKYENENKMMDKEMTNLAAELVGGSVATMPKKTGAVTVNDVSASPWYEKAWNGIKNFGANAWELLQEVSATIVTVISSILEGIAKLVENVVDAGAYIGGALVTGGAWIGDRLFGTDTYKDIWNSVNGFVSKNHVGSWWDLFYNNTSYGQWMKEYSFMNPQGTAANIITGAGDIIGIILIGAVCPPAGMAVAGVSAFGASSELGTQNNDSFGKVLLKGGVSALISVALMGGLGGTVSSKLPSIGGKITSKASSLTTRLVGSRGGQFLAKTGGKIATGIRNLAGIIVDSGVGRWVSKTGGKITSATKSLTTRVSGTKFGSVLSKVNSKVSNGAEEFIGPDTGVMSKVKNLFTKTGSKTGSKTTSGVTNIDGKTVFTSVGSKPSTALANPNTALSIIKPGALSTEVLKTGASSVSKISAKGLVRMATASVGYGLAMDKSNTSPSNSNTSTTVNMGDSTVPNGKTTPPSESTSKGEFTEKGNHSNQKNHSNNNNKHSGSNNNKKGSSSNSSGSSHSSSNSAVSTGSSNKKNATASKNSKPKQTISSKPKNSGVLVNESEPDSLRDQDITTSIEPGSDPVVNPSVDIPSEDNTPVDNSPSNEEIITPVEDTPTDIGPSNEAVATPVEDTPVQNTLVENSTASTTGTYHPSGTSSSSQVSTDNGVVEVVEEPSEIPIEDDNELFEEDITTTPSKKVTKTLDLEDDSDVSNGRRSGNVAIPIGLGLAGAGAAAVAGARYIKGRKESEEYEDEDSQLDYEIDSSDSEYMDDNYLGPSGSSYTDTTGLEDISEADDDIPEDISYTDASDLESDEDDLENDIVFNELNEN